MSCCSNSNVGKEKGSAGVASWSLPWCLMDECFHFTLLQRRLILHQTYATLLLVCLRSLSTSLNSYMHPEGCMVSFIAQLE
jgi:hypothetical protein